MINAVVSLLSSPLIQNKFNNHPSDGELTLFSLTIVYLCLLTWHLIAGFVTKTWRRSQLDKFYQPPVITGKFNACFACPVPTR
jgi:hypothetical protein